jgi:hypothetical protein
MLSQTLSVPVYESAQEVSSRDSALSGFTHPPARSMDSHAPPSTSLSGSQSGSNCFSTPRWSVPTGLTVPSSPGSGHPGISSNQIQRNNDRLRARNQRAEAEIVELREANRAGREDMGRADAILEELMDSHDVPAGLYESLTKLSKLLETASEKLRKSC